MTPWVHFPDITDELKQLNLLAFVQANPHRFLPWGKADGATLASLLVFDQLHCDPAVLISFRIDNWYAVGSSEDWLDNESDHFQRLVRIRSMRRYCLTPVARDEALNSWDEVLGVFTERSPCGDCFEALQTTIAKDRQLPVVYLVPYFKEDTMAPLKVFTHYFGKKP